MATDDRKVQLGFVADTSSAKKEILGLKDSVDEMADGVQKAGQKAAKGLDGMAAPAKNGATEVDRAQRSIIASIERATAAMKAGGKAGADYYELLGEQRGIGKDVLAPYIAQLRQAEAAQKAVTAATRDAEPVHAATAQGMQKVGMSAAAMSAAMRNVPAQFTDIVVSLQSGQQPLTVLLQQGGQLKDMFGGVGPAAKALGTYALGLVSPLTLAAAAVGVLAYAYHEGAQEQVEYNKSLALSGNYAGTTASQMADMAASVSKSVGTQHAAAQALAEIAATGKITGDSMTMVTRTALEMEKATGQSMQATIANFVSLADEPTKASAKLNESLHYLSASTYEQIAAMEKAGKTDEAAALAQKSYADAMSGRAKQVVESLGYLETAAKATGGFFSKMWDAVLGVGRDLTGSEQLALMKKQLERMNTNGAPALPALKADFEKERQTLVDKIALQERLNTQLAAQEKAKGERAQLDDESVKAQEKIAAATAQFAGKQEQLNRELRETKAYFDKIRAADPNSPLLKTEQTLLDNIRQKYKEKGAAATDHYAELANNITKFNLEAQQELASGIKLTAADKFRSEQLAKLSEAYQKRQITFKQLIELEAQMEASAVNREGADQSLARAKADQAAGEAHVKYIQSVQDGTDKIQAETDKQRQATAELGLTKDAIGELRAAELERQATVLEGKAIRELDHNLNESDYEITMRQVAALRQLANAKRAYGDKEAVIEADKETKKFSDGVERDLSKAFAAAFRSTKDPIAAFGQSLQETILSRVAGALGESATTSVLGALGLAKGNAAKGADGKASADPVADLLSKAGNSLQDYLGKATGGIEDLVGKASGSVGNFLSQATSGLGDYLAQAASGLGDVLSSLFSSMSGGGGGGGLMELASSFFAFADGGVMTSQGSVPLRKYSAGGIANSAQLAMYGEGSQPEAFVPLPDGRSIPVTLQGLNALVPVQAGQGGTANVSVVVENHGTDATATATKQTMPDGSTLLRLILKTVADDAAGGGVTARAFQQRFPQLKAS